LFGFDAVVRPLCEPPCAGLGHVLLHHVFGEVGGRRRRLGHAIGGMGAITEAMAKAAREAASKILLDTPVEE